VGKISSFLSLIVNISKTVADTAGRLKMREWKMREWLAGVENAGVA